MSATNPSERRTVSVKDAAAQLGVCVNTIYNELRRPDCPFKTVKLRDRRLILQSSIDAFLDAAA